MWTSIWQHKFQQHRLSYFLLVSATTTTTKSPPFRWPRFLIPEFFFFFDFINNIDLPRAATNLGRRFCRQACLCGKRSTTTANFVVTATSTFSISALLAPAPVHIQIVNIWHSALLTPASFQISNHTGTQNFISCNFRLYSFSFSSCGGVMDHHAYCSLTCRSNVRAGYFYCTWVLAYLARTAMLIPCNLTGSHLPWWLHRF